MHDCGCGAGAFFKTEDVFVWAAEALRKERECVEENRKERREAILRAREEWNEKWGWTWFLKKSTKIAHVDAEMYNNGFYDMRLWPDYHLQGVCNSIIALCRRHPKEVYLSHQELRQIAPKQEEML